MRTTAQGFERLGEGQMMDGAWPREADIPVGWDERDALV
jgi:uncharacterized protein YbdZ (MbtH family)